MKNLLQRFLVFALFAGALFAGCTKDSVNGPQQVLGTYSGTFTISGKTTNGSITITRPTATKIRIEPNAPGQSIAAIEINNTKEKIDEIDPITEAYAKEHTLVRLMDADWTKNGKTLQYIIDDKSILVTGISVKDGKFEGKKQ